MGGSIANFQKIVQEMPQIKILILHGDTDLHFPLSNMRDIVYEQLIDTSMITISTKWHAWPCQGQVGGYIEKYNNGQLTFMSVRGGGHYPFVWKPYCTSLALADWYNDKENPYRLEVKTIGEEEKFMPLRY